MLVWPKADALPRAGDYVARHPTRYTFRPDVERWANYIVDAFPVWVVTYHDHPEGYKRDEDSLDVWGPGGRGDPLDQTVGEKVFDLLFHDPYQPDIEWIIYRRWIWTRSGGWKPFGTNAFTYHDDHIHVTYRRIV